jgi:hypothetical protein
MIRNAAMIAPTTSAAIRGRVDDRHESLRPSLSLDVPGRRDECRRRRTQRRLQRYLSGSEGRH